MLTRRLERVLGEKFRFFCFDLENFIKAFFFVKCYQFHGSIFLRHWSHMQRLSQKSEVDGRSILLVPRDTVLHIVSPALTTQAICPWRVQSAQFPNPQTRVLASVTHPSTKHKTRNKFHSYLTAANGKWVSAPDFLFFEARHDYPNSQ